MKQPYSQQAEQAVIGAMLKNKLVISDVTEILSFSDFYEQKHGSIFQAIVELEGAGITPDLLAVSEKLRKDSQDVSVTYLAELYAQVATTATVSQHAKIVRENSVLRQLISKSTRHINQAYDRDFENLEDFISQAEAEILELNSKQHSGGLVPVRSLIMAHLEDMENRKPGITGIKTPWDDLNYMTNGLQRSDLIILAGRPSMGKAQPLYSKIKTPTGWKCMGELKIGDELASPDGNPSIVTGIFPQGKRQIYHIMFSDGRSTHCCGEHLWKIFSSKWNGDSRIVTTNEIAEKLEKTRYYRRLKIPLVCGEFGHKDVLPLDPWLLGAMIGNGCLLGGRTMVSTNDAETLYHIQKAVGSEMQVDFKGSYDYIIKAIAGHKNTVMSSLRNLELYGCKSEEKFIPHQYLNASKENRMELLRGLLDTDGWVEKFGSVRFSTSSSKLSTDIQLLVRSLGGLCTISDKIPYYVYRGERKQGQNHYICNIRMPEPEKLFRLKRKKRRCSVKKPLALTIVSVEPVGTETVQCISVSHPSQLYITDDYIVTHNTSVGMHLACEVALNGGHVAVFTLETKKTRILDKMIMQQARIDGQRMRIGSLSQRDWHMANRIAAKLHGSSLHIDDNSNVTVLDIRSRCRRLKQKAGLDLVVIDYLGLINPHKKAESRNLEIGYITKALKGLAKELDVPVVLLAQLNRQVSSRADKKPQLTDLRESGNIEQDADVVMFVHRDEYYNADSEKKGIAEFVIAKQREGPTGIVEVGFLKEFTLFVGLVRRSD